ncbi:MAG: hypothetical protein QOE31_3569 [Solirubrobacteraceae bacterium]|jgi:hypothetical protein|nr:hypothetical protein [Solirubrobacteraceae bacterium]
MTTLRTALATCLLLLATTASADAAPPWSAPLTLGPPANGARAVGLGFSARGDGLLGWRLGTSSFVGRVDSNGLVGAPTRLPADLAAGPALASSPLPSLPNAGRAIIVMRRLRAPAPAPAGTTAPTDHSRLTWAVVRPDATLGPVHALVTADCQSCQVSLAVNWLGEAIAVWREERGALRAAFRPAGGRFGKPVTVFSGRNGQYPSFTAAIGSDGRAIVVDAGNVVRARVRTPRRGFGPAMRVGRGNDSVQVTTAISNGGRAIVAWGSQDGGEEANEPWIVRAARLARGGRRFTATQTLDPGAAINRPEGSIALAFTPGGRATIAWSSVAAASTFPVMVAAAGTGGRFAAAQQLAPSGAVGGLAVRADGAAVVSWSSLIGSQQPIQVFGSVRPAGATTFAAAEAIGVPEVGIGASCVAIDPVSGRAVVAWDSRPKDPTTPQEVNNATVHVAARPAP